MPSVHSPSFGALALIGLLGQVGAVSASMPSATPAVKWLGRSTVQVQGVRVRAAAYFARHSGYQTPSRYDVQIKKAPPGPPYWELYNPLWGPEGGQGMIGQESVSPYRPHQRQALVTCRLRQYDEQEERVTFHDLTIVRFMGFGFLTLTKPQTATTPSGITVSLPVQSQKTFMPGGSFDYNGPPDVVFARVSLSPGAKQSTLPASPLYRRHRGPVSIHIDTAAPVFLSYSSGDSALPQLHLSLRDRKATHLDTLTLVIHQRADLQSIPLAFRVPITRQPPRELFAGVGG